MKLNSNYLCKSYFVATMLQYNDELKKEGFATETKKKFLFGGEAFVADLYAENESEKRIYDFQLAGKKEGHRDRTAILNSLCESVGAKPIVIYVKTPVEKQILFDELETIINDYFLSGDLPPELAELPGETAINAVKVEEIFTASFEHSLISLSGCSTLYVTLQYKAEGAVESADDRVCCERFPLSFTIGLDSDYNCKTLEYEIDLSEFESKKEEVKPTAGNKSYISKAKFDTEFKIYQDISETLLTMTADTGLLFPRDLDPLPQDNDKETAVFEELARKAAASRAAADKTFKRYAPFVPKKLFGLLEVVLAKCGQQLYWYSKIVLNANASGYLVEKEACAGRANEISDLQGLFMDDLRKHLDSLDVK